MVDPGSWAGWDEPPDHGPVSSSYAESLARAEARSGVDEAVVVGRALIGGHPAALIVSEFGFLGGSVGRATAARIVAAMHRATAERLPVVAATASGGTRMQEGTPAFVAMVPITRAVVAHKLAGLPYLVYLRNPTTGGVLASWGSLGHMTLAEPGALVGFLGPTVFAALSGAPFPGDVQRAENLVAHGVIDAVVSPGALAGVLTRALTLLTLRPPGRSLAAPGVTAVPGRGSGRTSLQLSRHPERPGVRDLLERADDVLELGGTQGGEVGPALVFCLTSFDTVPCVLVGQDRRSQAHGAAIGPGDLRVARRAIDLAQELALPLICVIDTPGAALSPAAEEGALAGEIARCLADLAHTTVPSVSVLLGEGCGGAALALLPAQRVIAAENAWLAPLPLEGGSVIIHGNPDHALDLADAQHITAGDLLDCGVVDTVIAEPAPAHETPAAFLAAVAAEIARQVSVARQLRTSRQVEDDDAGVAGCRCHP